MTLDLMTALVGVMTSIMVAGSLPDLDRFKQDALPGGVGVVDRQAWPLRRK